MNEPKSWSLEELTSDSETSRELFRKQRLDEPLALYSEFFNDFVPVFGRIIDRLPRLAGDSIDPEAMPDLVQEGDSLTAFRYLAAPPVSEDDLKTLAETTLSATALRSNPAEARRVRDIVLHIIDPHRFPWIKEDRGPTPHERDRAVVASAALVAVRKVETSRRSGAKKEQEESVKAALREIGFAEVLSRDIPNLDAAPGRGEFCGECRLGGTRADLLIRLHDRRVMPVECKVSNSAVNSFKRINHEAAGKARDWLDGFGRRQTVPGAVISGVFNPANLETAQSEGLSLYWGHRLSDLRDFIESTRSAG